MTIALQSAQQNMKTKIQNNNQSFQWEIKPFLSFNHIDNKVKPKGTLKSSAKGISKVGQVAYNCSCQLNQDSTNYSTLVQEILRNTPAP